MKIWILPIFLIFFKPGKTPISPGFCAEKSGPAGSWTGLGKIGGKKKARS